MKKLKLIVSYVCLTNFILHGKNACKIWYKKVKEAYILDLYSEEPNIKYQLIDSWIALPLVW